MEKTIAPLIPLLVMVLTAQTALALPRPGDRSPDARVQSSMNGAYHAPSKLRGKLVLIFYEGQESKKQNAPLRKHLHQLHLQDKIKPDVVMFPVADVRGYSMWPLKGIAKSKVRAEGKKFGLDILCDWDGSFGNTFGFDRDKSNVVLIGSDGKVLFSAWGPVNRTSWDKLLKYVVK